MDLPLLNATVESPVSNSSILPLNFTEDGSLPYCNFTDFNRAYSGIHGYVSLFVCVLGSVANSLNIAVLTRKDMQSPTNMILTALAVADLLVMVENIPMCYYLISNVNKNAYPTALFLLLHSNFTNVFHTVSIFLTVMLAVWRYIAIAHPHVNRIWVNSGMTIISIVVVYIACVILCIPMYLTYTIRPHTISINTSDGKTENVTKYAVGEAQLGTAVSFWMYSVCIKIIPCFLLTILSLRLIFALMKAKERKQQLNSHNLLNDDAKSRLSVKKSKKLALKERQADRTTRMLLVVLLLFLITEFPQGILGLVGAILGDKFLRACYYPLGDVMDFLALFNSAINFMIYCSMSRQFRITFNALFKPRILDKWLPATRVPGSDNEATQVTQV